MRYFLLILIVIAALITPIATAQEDFEEITFADGVVTLLLPIGWVYQEGNTGLTFAPDNHSLGVYQLAMNAIFTSTIQELDDPNGTQPTMTPTPIEPFTVGQIAVY